MGHTGLMSPCAPKNISCLTCKLQINVVLIFFSLLDKLVKPIDFSKKAFSRHSEIRFTSASHWHLLLTSSIATTIKLCNGHFHISHLPRVSLISSLVVRMNTSYFTNQEWVGDWIPFFYSCHIQDEKDKFEFNLKALTNASGARHGLWSSNST